MTDREVSAHMRAYGYFESIYSWAQFANFISADIQTSKLGDRQTKKYVRCTAHCKTTYPMVRAYKAHSMLMTEVAWCV